MTTQDIILSICIPTYNRADLLKEALDSILAQDNSRIEVIVCDNASADNTEEVVKEYKDKFHKFLFHKIEKNIGACRCLIKSTEIASGKYFWLLGSDDKICQGAIEKVIEQIDADNDLTGLTFAFDGYDLEMKNKIALPNFVSYEKDTLVTSIEDFALNLFPYYGYLSCTLFRKDRFDETLNSTPIDHLILSEAGPYVLAYVLTKVFMKYPRILYLVTPCIQWRSDNDSFEVELGRLRRYEILAPIINYIITENIISSRNKWSSIDGLF